MTPARPSGYAARVLAVAGAGLLLGLVAWWLVLAPAAEPEALTCAGGGDWNVVESACDEGGEAGR